MLLHTTRLWRSGAALAIGCLLTIAVLTAFSTFSLWAWSEESILFIYSFASSLPQPHPISQVPPSKWCPSPATTAPTVTMGNPETPYLECKSCFTSRWSAYGIFFHMPHDRPNELGALREWAFARTPVLTGIATYAYSSTATFEWQNRANIDETTACFYTQILQVDTGGIGAGSPEALGIYLL